MTNILILARLQIGLIVLFVFCKVIRPSVLAGEAPTWLKTLLLSIPNFFEAVIGVLILTGFGLFLNLKVLSENRQIKRNLIYVLALFIGGVYVVSQELKFHNLGGNNVYDQNDLIYSVVGLIIGFLMVVKLQPQAYPVEEDS